jgi:transposase-like protein
MPADGPGLPLVARTAPSCALVCVRSDRAGRCREPEACCRAYLEQLRWPDGVVCIRCGSTETTRLEARRRFACRRCRHFFSLTSGTVMHRSHVPLWKWFLAVRLLVESNTGTPANQLAARLGGSYKTAWFIEHRVRAAMAQAQGLAPVGLPPGTALSADGLRVYERDVAGAYQQYGLDYVAAYRAESEWRTRQAGNPDRLRETLRALLGAEPLTYDELVSPARRRRLAGSNGFEERSRRLGRSDVPGEVKSPDAAAAGRDAVRPSTRAA